MENTSHIVLLARVPLPGHVKTRLIPRLGEEGASEFARAALLDLMHLMSSVPHCRRILCYTPESAAPDLRSLLRQESLADIWELHPQPPNGDLGVRLSAAIQHIETTFTSEPSDTVIPTVTFMGMDCLDLTPQSVSKSMRSVSRSAKCAHMIPAIDGGYVLLTLPLRCHREIVFSNITWSSDQTGRMQLQRLEESGLVCEPAEALPDVDEPNDLDRLWRDRTSKMLSYPRTMEYLNGVMETRRAV